MLISLPFLISVQAIVVVNQGESGVNHHHLPQTKSISSASSTGSGEWQGKIFVGQVAADAVVAADGKL